MKQTIAQRKAAGAKRTHILSGIVSCVPFAAVAYFCKYVLPGYSFTALVCLGIIAVILFYTFVPMLGTRYPVLVRRLIGWFTALLVIGMLAACVTEYFIIRASFGSPSEDVTYLVVLGAKVRPDGPSVSLWDRIYGAYDYLNAHPDTIAVVSGGQGNDEVISEAQCMYDELVKLGISPERIWMEERSSNTRENLTFSLNLIEEKTGSRPGKLGVLSSEYHMLRAGMVAKSCGVEFVGVPAHTSRISQQINHFMREIAAVWKYAILGGNGND